MGVSITRMIPGYKFECTVPRTRTCTPLILVQ